MTPHPYPAVGEIPALIVLSARTELQLRAIARRLEEHLKRHALADDSLVDIAYTLQAGREAMRYRFAVGVASIAELAGALRTYTNDPSSSSGFQGDVKADRSAVAGLNAGGTVQDLVAGWLHEGDWSRVLKHWAKGLDFDWGGLYAPNGVYAQAQARRIALPTYPFEPRRFWIDQQASHPRLPPAPLDGKIPSEGPRTAIRLGSARWALKPMSDEPATKPEGTRHCVFVHCHFQAHVPRLAGAHPDVDWRLLPAPDPADPIRISAAAFERLREMLATPATHTLVQAIAPLADETEEASPEVAALHGMFASARLEDSRFAGQVIALGRDASSFDLQAAVFDNAKPAARADQLVRGVGSRRQVKRLVVEVVSPVDAYSSPWKDSGVYLLAGGAGGLGRLLARGILDAAARPTLILTGRSEPTAHLMDDLRAHPSGGVIEARALDVTDSGAVEAFLSNIRARHGRLNGVVHLAGVVDDSLLQNKSLDQFRAVLRPKVLGALNLDAATRADDLDLFLLFSSLSGVLGNAGQTDYASANAYLDSFAGHRQARVRRGERRGRTVSLDWPLWASGGMGVSAERLQLLREDGFEPLPAQNGLRALGNALALESSQILILSGREDTLDSLFAPSSSGYAAAQDAAQTGPTANLALAMAHHDDEALGAEILSRLQIAIAAHLQIDSQELHATANFSEYGFDSISLGTFSAALNREYGLKLRLPMFFEHPTLETFARFLLASHRHAFVAAASAELATDGPAAPAPRSPPGVEPPPGAGEPIAIIAMSGRFPGADTLDAFWENLKAGRDDLVGDVPLDRWNAAEFFDGERGVPGKSYSKWGSFLDAPHLADPLFFNISPKSAEAIAPEELQFLEITWRLLEARGLTRMSIRDQYRGKVGVYVGTTFHHLGFPGSDVAAVAAAAVNAHGAIANRVSNYLGLNGPSLVLDTMCSSSATAIHVACDDLRRGACEMAIAGGVNLLSHPLRYVGLAQAQLLASHPQARSFGTGDGYHPAEAVGAFLLKPLARAVADGDPILAIIRGSATMHAGGENAYSAPSPNIQSELVAEALRRAGLEPADIDYVEAAAVGSQLGDAIELVALNRVFSMRAATSATALGTVKAGLGHPEAASTVAQLAKVILQLQNEQIAPTPVVAPLNPELAAVDQVLRLVTVIEPWPRRGIDHPRRRRALINAFGAGGAYACLIVEEAPARAAMCDAGGGAPAAPFPVVLSARTPPALRDQMRQVLEHFRRHPSSDLSALSETLLYGREAMVERWAVVVADAGELCTEIERELAGASSRIPDAEDVCEGASPVTLAGDLAAAARAWRQGQDVAWRTLFPPRGLPVSQIPVHPFARLDIRGSAAPQRQPPPAAESSTRRWADPRSILQDLLYELFAIPRERVGGKLKLIELGVNSLELLRLRHQLEAVLDIEVPLRTLGGRQTIDEICGALKRLTGETGNSAPASPRLPHPEGRPIPDPGHRSEPFALTDLQEAYFVGRRLTRQGGVAPHLYFEFAFAELDVYRLSVAWNRMVERHDMLRAVAMADGQRQAVQSAPPAFRIKVRDFRQEADPEPSLQAVRTRMLGRSYDPTQWPLFDIRVSLTARGAILHLSFDEFIIDGQSLDILLEEWRDAYQSPEVELPPLALSFRDVVVARRAVATSARHARDRAYWREKFVDGLMIPNIARSDLSGANTEGGARTRLVGGVSFEAWDRLKARAAAAGASPTTLLLAVFSEILRAWSKTDLFALMLTYANRPPLHADMQRLVGPFASTGIFRTEAGATTFMDLVGRYQAQVWADVDHGSVSGLQVLRDLRSRRQIPGALTIPVVFTSLLGHRGRERDGTGPASFGVGRFYENHTPQVLLDHHVSETDDALTLSWDISVDALSLEVARGMFGTYRAMLLRIAAMDDDLSLQSLRDMIAAEVSPTPDLAQAAVPLLRRDPDIVSPFRLTDQQQAYAFARLSRGGSPEGCHCYYEYEASHLDIPRLEAAWLRVLDDHPMLTARVDASGHQRFAPGGSAHEIRVEDLRGQAHVAQSIALDGVKQAMLSPAPLESWPYCHLRVSRTTPNIARLHIVIDMLVADGHSIVLILRDLFKYYEAPGAPSGAASVNFRDYVLWRESYRKTPQFQADLAYWQSKFATLAPGPKFELPLEAAGRARSRLRLVDRITSWKQIQSKAAAEGVSPSAVLLAAYMEVLGAWSSVRTFGVVVPGWRRPALHPEIDQIVGDFTTMSWIENCDVLKSSFMERVLHCERQLRDDFARQGGAAYVALRRALAQRGREALIFPVVFTEIVPNSEPERDAPGFRLVEALSQTPEVQIDCMSHDEGASLQIYWDVDVQKVSADLATQMFGDYRDLLEQIGADPGAWSRRASDDGVAPRSIASAQSVADAWPEAGCGRAGGRV